MFGKTLTDVQSKLNKYTMSNVKEQLTSDDELTKILSDSEASNIVNTLNKIKDKTSEEYASFDDYFKELSEDRKGYVADYVKENQSQIYVTKDVIEASRKAQQNQIAHNEVVQQSTLAFKASKVAMQGLAMAGNMIAMWAITEVVSWAVNKFDELHVTVEESRESLKNLKQESTEIESNLQSLNDQLMTTQQRMKELENTGGLSISEEEEYDNLVKQNNELQRSIDLLKLEQKEKNKEKNKAFVDTMEKDVAKQDEYSENISTGEVSYGYGRSKQDSPTYSAASETDYINYQFKEIERLKGKKNNASKEADKDRIQGQIDDIFGYLNDKNAEFTTDAEGIDYIQNPTTEDDEKVNEWLDYINDFQDKMAIAMDGDNAKTNAFNRVVDNWQFDDTVQSLQDLGKTGDVTLSSLKQFENNEEFEQFLEKLDELGVIDNTEDLEQVVDLFNTASINATEATDSLDKFTSSSDSLSTLNNAFREMSDNGYLTIGTISNLKEAVGDSISNWDEYEQKLLTVQKGSDEFNQIMGELTYATLEGKLGVEGLAEADEKYIASILRENGVLNANTTAHDMVTAAREKAQVQAYIQEQGLDTLISTLANEENALMMQASACGLSTNAYAALLAQEIAFNTNDINVSNKLTKLSAIAVQAGLAAIEVDKLNTVMNGKGLKEDFATENGIGVIKTSGRTTKNKNGKTVANWQYEYNGVVYESLDDAYFAKEYDELMNKLEMPTPTVTYSNTNSPNSTSASQSFKETFNWIETALSRVQRAVTNFGKTVAATWQSWSTRNAALKNQISAIRQEISLQDQAYNKYMSLANSVGLSEGYKRLVENGAIDISTIESESIAEAIKQYQDYYEKALAAKDASADLKDELAALSQTKFDNLVQSFADLMSGNEHAISMYEATIDLMEKRGYVASASLYDSLKEAETKNQDILRNKYQSLSQALDEAVSSGTVVKYSEQWYQMQNEILAVEEAILDSNNALAEFDNSLRELEWNAFDKLHEQISEIHEETEFLDKLLSEEKKFNEDGSITKYGQAALGLHAVNYKTYLAQAEEYAQELERIRQDLANDPYNQTLLDREDELLEKQRETIQSAEDEKQAMIDIASEGYDTLLDYMDKLIDKRKDMLSQAKDLYEYEKNISEQTKEITSLEKQLAAYQGDDSEEARATIQKLQVSLEEAKDNLEETEYDKYISDQEELLETLRLQTEEWINARLDNEDQLLKDIVSSTEKNATMIKDTLSQVVSATGTTLSDAMKSIWSNDGDIGKAITEIKSYLANMQKDADEKAKEQTANNTPTTSDSGTTTATAPTTSTPAATNASKWGDFFIHKTDSYPKGNLKKDTSIVDRLKYFDYDSSFSARSQYYTAMGGSGIYTGSSSQNTWMIAQMKANGYAKGGFIGDMIRAAGEDGIALVRRGEGIIPTNMVPEWNALIHHLPQLNHSVLGSIPQHETNVSIDIGDIQMYGVNDPEAFAHQLKQTMLNNNSIRNIMKDTTIGEAIGRNSMIRYTR